MAFEFTGTVMLAETIAATEGTAAALTAFEAMPLAAESLMASAPEFASLGSQLGAAGAAMSIPGIGTIPAEMIGQLTTQGIGAIPETIAGATPSTIAGATPETIAGPEANIFQIAPQQPLPQLSPQEIEAFQQGQNLVQTGPSPYAQFASNVTSDVPTPLVQTPAPITPTSPMAETAPGTGLKAPTTKLPTMFNMPGAREALAAPDIGAPSTVSELGGLKVPTGPMPAPEANPFVQGFNDVTNWMKKNPFTTAALGYGALNMSGALRPARAPTFGGPPAYSSPYRLSPNFQPGPYAQPNVYQPRYAEGGILQLQNGGGPVERMSQMNTAMNPQGGLYPQGMIDKTQYATPIQRPVSSEMVMEDSAYERSNPMLMASGGITALARGSDPSDKAFRDYDRFAGFSKMMQGQTPTAPDDPAWVRSVGIMEDTDPDTKYQDALTAALIRQGKINKRANTATPAMARPTPMGTINLAPPGTQQAASGGIMGYSLGGYAAGGNPRLLEGPGDGMSDDIPATIGSRQPARLADGEFVVPADVVSGLGNGSTNAGAKKLHKMMDKVRMARTGKKKQAPEIKADKYLA